MKILVLSDIHANAQALQTVLAAQSNIDIICCTGDFVDYGIAPAPVINTMRHYPAQQYYTMGNHDTLAIEAWADGAYKAVPNGAYKWLHYNCERMQQDDIDFLKSLPAVCAFEADGYAYVMQHMYHGYDTIQSLPAFNDYWAAHAPENLRNHPNRRAIFGHTHRRCIHMLDNNALWLNPGSISYRRPDDADKTAHYMIIDNGAITMHSLAYNRNEALQVALQERQRGAMMPTEIRDFEFFFGDKPWLPL